MNNFFIDRIIYRGRYVPLKNPLRLDNFKKSEKVGMGSITGNLQDYSCPRCEENWGYVFCGNHGKEFFCGTAKCLKEDSDCSRADARDAYNQEKLRQYGTKYMQA
jgi:hypothetical protein